MQTRREFLMMSSGLAAMVALSAPAYALQGKKGILHATAVTQVFGDGVRLIAVAIEYDSGIDAARLAPTDFKVEGRTVTEVFASRSANPADRAATGNYVIVALSLTDKNALLAQKVTSPDRKSPAQGGPGKAGDVPFYDTVYPPAKATLTQLAPLVATSGDRVSTAKVPLVTEAVKNLVVDDFKQYVFHDAATGKSLKYNLFIPENGAFDRRLPLVLFMHDAGATSDVTRTTLFQGLGAVAWASPQDQAQRPCFVLAPQYGETIADDDSHTSAMLDITINLINALAEQYPVDRSRLYTTGQSGGCMMSIAMDCKYPDFFAASFLVAGQWDPTLVAPLARQKLWILVSQDDDKAWPGQNAITETLAKAGAKISRAEWDGTWDEKAFRTAFERIDAEKSPVNYVAFRKGTVIPEGQSAAGASGHRNTWRIAYTIEPIREWLFRQKRSG